MVANQGEILAVVEDSEDQDGSQAEAGRDAFPTRSQSIYRRNIDKFFHLNKQYLILASPSARGAERQLQLG